MYKSSSGSALCNEKDLWAQVSSGNEASFRILFDHYKTRLFNLSLKIIKSPIIAEDIVQEVFLSIWKNKDKLSSIEDIPAYIFTITYNQIFKNLKKISSHNALMEDLINNTCIEQNTTGEMVDAEESQSVINKAINHLPPRRQAIYKLSRQEGMSHDEIANYLQISRSTVKNQLVHALKYIRSVLRHNISSWILIFF